MIDALGVEKRGPGLNAARFTLDRDQLRYRSTAMQPMLCITAGCTSVARLVVFVAEVSNVESQRRVQPRLQLLVLQRSENELIALLWKHNLHNTT